ncbi:MAG: hypothetical protein ABUU24_01520, partial [Variovorax sp.]
QPSNGAVAPQIVVARWDIATGQWSTPQVVQTSTLRGSNPQLSVAANGDATVAWTQTTAAASLVIDVVQLSHTTGVGTVPYEVSGTNGSATWPQVKTDAGGDVTVLWEQSSGNYAYSLSTARYHANLKAWSAPIDIEQLSNYAFNPFSVAPTMTVDDGGNLTAAWLQGDGSGANPSVYAVRYDGRSAAWGVPKQLNGTAWGDASIVSTTVDSHGNVLAGWGVQDVYYFDTPTWALLTGP